LQIGEQAHVHGYPRGVINFISIQPGNIEYLQFGEFGDEMERLYAHLSSVLYRCISSNLPIWLNKGGERGGEATFKDFKEEAMCTISSKLIWFTSSCSRNKPLNAEGKGFTESNVRVRYVSARRCGFCVTSEPYDAAQTGLRFSREREVREVKWEREEGSMQRIRGMDMLRDLSSVKFPLK